MKIKQTLKNMF